MTSSGVLTIVALAAPVVQVLLMGVIGYPLTRGDSAKMERFHRSGLLWWIIALIAIIASALIAAPDLLAIGSLAGHGITASRVLITLIVGISCALALELLAEHIVMRFGSPKLVEARERYNTSVPLSARGLIPEISLLAIVVFLQEAVYRGIVLSGLISWAGFSEFLAAGMCSIAFGAAYWYFGREQILLKSITSGVFCGVAFSIGWIGAAAVHILVNVILSILARRAEPKHRNV